MLMQQVGSPVPKSTVVQSTSEGTAAQGHAFIKFVKYNRCYYLFISNFHSLHMQALKYLF